MKKPIISAVLFISALYLSGINHAQAQNVQLFYDAGRGCATSTVEMFRPDAGGSTFFFIDFDYTPKATGAYWEISRELNFWQDSKVNWLSVHLEYNGGLSVGTAFNNSFLGGLTYSGHSKDFTKTWSISAMYKAIPGTKDASGNNRYIISRLQVYGESSLRKAGVHSADSLTSGASIVLGKKLNSYS